MQDRKLMPARTPDNAWLFLEDAETTLGAQRSLEVVVVAVGDLGVRGSDKKSYIGRLSARVSDRRVKTDLQITCGNRGPVYCVD
jgi:hypothetical protein